MKVSAAASHRLRARSEAERAFNVMFGNSVTGVGAMSPERRIIEQRTKRCDRLDIRKRHRQQ
jgi:hypothetical protein